MGLSPIMVDKIFEVVRDVYSPGRDGAAGGTKRPSAPLQIADRGYVMDSGEITMTGEGRAMLDDPKVREAYLGEAAG
jgi:branched-chain amino acid transport system ATP-binding protein